MGNFSLRKDHGRKNMHEKGRNRKRERERQREQKKRLCGEKFLIEKFQLKIF